MKMYVKASTKPKNVLNICLYNFFNNTLSESEYAAISQAFINWKGEDAFWFHHGNGNGTDHRPENIVLIRPDAHRKLHTFNKLIDIAKASGQFDRHYNLNEIEHFDDIILEYVLSLDFVQNKTLLHVFDTIITPLIPSIHNKPTDYIVDLVHNTLVNSNIDVLTLDELDAFVEQGFDPKSKSSIARVDNETAQELINIIDDLEVKYKNDPTKQKMHEKSLRIVKEFINSNLVTRQELYDEFILGMWKHSV